MVREGLRCLLEASRDVRVVAESGDGDDLVRLAGSTAADLVIVDPGLPGLNGAPLIAALTESAPHLSIIVLAGEGDDLDTFARLGAAACVSRRASSSTLIAAIREHGDTGGRRDEAIETRPRDARAEALTARELEVLSLAALGLTNREIAQRLNVTRRTVQFHLAQVFAKLGATSRTGAVHRARQQGLIT